MKSSYTQQWLWFAQHFRRPVLLFLFGVVTAVAPTVILPVIGILVRYTFDQAIPHGDIARLGLITCGVVLLLLLNSGLALATRNRTLSMTKEAITRLRTDLLQALYSASWIRFSNCPTGQVHSIFIQDTQLMDAMSNAIVWEVLPGMLVSVTLWIYLICVEWRIGLLFSLLLLTMGLVTIVFRQPMKRRSREHHQAIHNVSSGLLAALRTMLLTRAEAVESVEIAKQSKHFEQLRDASIRNNWTNSAYRIVQDTIILTCTLAILVIGGIFVNAGWISLGELLSAFVVVSLIRGYAQKLASGIPALVEGTGALQRLSQLGSMRDTLPYSGKESVDLRQGVAFESVSFGYSDLDLLQGIDLSLDPGTMVVVMGANGTGKTTLGHLVMGFIAPTEGHLTVHGQPYAELDIESLRRQTSFLPQDPILFPDTLLENVRYGYPSATRDEVIQALGRAQAETFVAALPQGIDTVLEQEGIHVSGGERQKIAIARVLVKPSRLLVLDEVTNHLDAASRLAVIQELRNLPMRPAILVLTHDESMIEAADRVYRIQAGRLVRVSMPTLKGSI